MYIYLFLDEYINNVTKWIKILTFQINPKSITMFDPRLYHLDHELTLEI